MKKSPKEIDHEIPKSIFKSKGELICFIIFSILFLIGFIYFGTRDYTLKKGTDSEKFTKEFSIVKEDNIYKYISVNDANTYMTKDNVIILFGIPNNDFVGAYAKLLNDVAKEMEIEEIYYCDIYEDRKNNTGAYGKLVDYLSNRLYALDDGKVNLYVPSLLVKKDGNIILFDKDSSIRTSDISAEEYFNNFRVNSIKNTLRTVLNVYKGENNGE